MTCKDLHLETHRKIELLRYLAGRKDIGRQSTLIK